MSNKYITQDNINNKRNSEFTDILETLGIVKKGDILLVVGQHPSNCIIITPVYLLVLANFKVNKIPISKINDIEARNVNFIVHTTEGNKKFKFIASNQDIQKIKEYLNTSSITNNPTYIPPEKPKSDEPKSDEPIEKFYLELWFIGLMFSLTYATTGISFIIGCVCSYLLHKNQAKKDEEIKLLEDNATYCEATLENNKETISNLENQLREHKSQFTREEIDLINANNQKDDLIKYVDSLRKEILVLEDTKELESFSVYVPKYDFPESSYFSNKITEIRNSQKEMIKNKIAATGDTNFTLNNSKKEGQKMMNDVIKLLLRAFNNECDISISKVKFSNVESSVSRIQKSYDTINTLGKHFSINISNKYLNLKLEELYLVHEFALKKQEEKEEQAAIREQMREEAKAQKEIENQMKKLEKESSHYTNAIEKAKLELDTVKDDEKDALLAKIRELENKLTDVDEKVKDVDYRNANQRAGYVYVISNIGSFGEDVFKIGMTRRLEPLDRVKELGDASVPFQFDVHAMIFSDDAPSLENALHKVFDNKKVNMMNSRKEFFNVTIDEIENAVKENFDKAVVFTKTAIAEEYRESLKIKETL